MKKISVLYAEDDTEIIEVVKEIISNRMPNQVRLDTVTNGYLALQRIKKERYDVLITDFDMPILNGMDLIKSLKSVHQQLRPQNVLMLSSFIEQGDPAPDVSFVTYMNKDSLLNNFIPYLESRHRLMKMSDFYESDEDPRKEKRYIPDPEKPIRVDIYGENFIEIVKARDISLSGVGVIVPDLIPNYTTSVDINCVITLPFQTSFKVKGIIRHVGSDDKFYFGIEFVDLSEENAEKIREYISQII